MKEILEKIFIGLDAIIAKENIEREEAGSIKLARVQVKILGQASLFFDENIVSKIS